MMTQECNNATKLHKYKNKSLCGRGESLATAPHVLPKRVRQGRRERKGRREKEKKGR